jgi:hypothetical protein
MHIEQLQKTWQIRHLNPCHDRRYSHSAGLPRGSKTKRAKCSICFSLPSLAPQPYLDNSPGLPTDCLRPRENSPEVAATSPEFWRGPNRLFDTSQACLHVGSEATKGRKVAQLFGRYWPIKRFRHSWSLQDLGKMRRTWSGEGNRNCLVFPTMVNLRAALRSFVAYYPAFRSD